MNPKFFALQCLRWELTQENKEAASSFIKGIEVALIEIRQASELGDDAFLPLINDILKDRDISEYVDALWDLRKEMKE